MKFTDAALLGSLVASASALHIPFKSRSTGFAAKTNRFRSRATTDPSDPFYFENLGGVLYAGTLSIDGQDFQVQLDSGSSDLWVDSTGITFASATSTGVEGSIQYLDTTSATGPIEIGSVTFGNWTAPKQAFISAPGTNATSLGDKGLLGVGPPTLSSIASTLNGTQYDGASFLDNVFNAYPDDPNMISFLLSRSESSGNTDGGDFTIGTIVPGYESIENSTVLPVISDSEWVTAMTGVVIDGQTSYQGHSSYLSGDQLSVLLDSGTSQGTAIKFYVDLFYSAINGSVWSEEDSTYLFPCDAIVDVSMVFGDQVVPLDPLDLSEPYGTNSDGSGQCYGTFSVNDGSGVDFILGDSFMRNVYSLFYFGEWTTADSGSPFMVVLPITDHDSAISAYPSLNAQRVANFVSSQSNSTSSDSSDTSHSVSGAVAGDSSSAVDLSGLNRNSYIIMGMAGLAIILLLANIVMASRKNQGYRPIGSQGSAPPAHFVDRSYETPYDDHGR